MEPEKIDGRNIPFYRSDCTPKEFKDNIPTRLPSSRDKTVRIPLKCALCLMTYFRHMKVSSICLMTGCSPLQALQCVNGPNYGYIIDACLDGRIRFRIRDEPSSSELGEL